MKHEEMEGTKGTTLSKHVWSLKRASPTPSPGPFRKGGGATTPLANSVASPQKLAHPLHAGGGQGHPQQEAGGLLQLQT